MINCYNPQIYPLKLYVAVGDDQWKILIENFPISIIVR